MNARQPFCCWMTFTKVSNPFLPSPPKWLKWPLEVCGGVGYEWFYWFSLYWKNFFPNLSAVRNFFPDLQGCKIFFSIVRHERYFFQCKIFFSQRACLFPLEISLQDIFSEITRNPSKVKWSAPKIHQTLGQLTDSDLSTISKDFWNNRGQNFLGERGGIRFYLPLPGKPALTSGRTYSDVIIKFPRMDSLPNFITHGAPLLLLLLLLLLLFMLLSLIFLLDRDSEGKLRLAALGLQNSSKQSFSSKKSCLLWQWYIFVVIQIFSWWLGKFPDTIPSVPITTGSTIVLTFHTRSSSLLWLRSWYVSIFSFSFSATLASPGTAMS